MASATAGSIRPVRPPLSQANSGQAPASPHTPPTRTFSSSFSPSYSSPSFSRGEDDCIVFEFGTRYLRAGFGGEEAPKCILNFGPHEQVRVGDYRRWVPGYESNWRKRKRGQAWGEAHELWRMDLRGLDLGLIEDRVERAVRKAFTESLLTDSKPRRFLLALPSELPHPLLSSLLQTLFSNFSPPSITLFPTPVLSTVAAGLRSGLVIDIGWRETTVTSIFEYREVHCSRSERATKTLVQAVARLLATELRKTLAERSTSSQSPTEDDFTNEISFEEAEDICVRLAWCRSHEAAEAGHKSEDSAVADHDGSQLRQQVESLSVDRKEDDDPAPAMTFDVPLGSSIPPTVLRLPCAALADAVEMALLIYDPSGSGYPDDNELPLPLLAYQALLALPVDVRGICMSRIVVVGGASNVANLKKRIIDEIASLASELKWNRVRGDATRYLKQKSNGNSHAMKRDGNTLSSNDANHATADQTSVESSAGLMDAEDDPVEQKLRREATKGAKPQVQGVVRGVDSLGPWVGGSLVAHLKIRGVVEVDREKFLQQGLEGASKQAESSVVPTRSSMGPGVGRGGPGDRSSWTLGIWA
ncbi:MAG: hypothetical protein M1833_002756 [Piccolia ochrophora]|nr:MAG: hypothetical protein M1833_002756 [Piccolia ochrophora]